MRPGGRVRELVKLGEDDGGKEELIAAVDGRKREKVLKSVRSRSGEAMMRNIGYGWMWKREKGELAKVEVKVGT